MKKLIALILVLIFLCIAPLALAEDWYLSTAEALSQRLSILVGNQTYLAFFIDVKQDGVEERTELFAKRMMQ